MADGGGNGPKPPETMEALEDRHARELEEMEARTSELVAAAKQSAGKGKKLKQATENAEREVEQLLYDLRSRQQAEVDELQECLSSAGGEAAQSPPPPAPAANDAADPCGADSEAAAIQRKKDKAQKKRQDKQDREVEREAAKERERLEAGPSAREQELAALVTQLAQLRPPLSIKEIAADGHCLYRSIGDQLRLVRPEAISFALGPERGHEEVRALCAGALERRRDQYAAFAELAEGEDFDGYCQRVRKSADWGGELELRALAEELQVCIHVFRADQKEPLLVGEGAAGNGPPLRVTFHRHYYSLGEHYNSVIPLAVP